MLYAMNNDEFKLCSEGKIEGERRKKSEEMATSVHTSKGETQ